MSSWLGRFSCTAFLPLRATPPNASKTLQVREPTVLRLTPPLTRCLDRQESGIRELLPKQVSPRMCATKWARRYSFSTDAIAVEKIHENQLFSRQFRQKIIIALKTISYEFTQCLGDYRKSKITKGIFAEGNFFQQTYPQAIEIGFRYLSIPSCVHRTPRSGRLIKRT